MAALGVQSIYLPTPYDGTSTEWVNVMCVCVCVCVCERERERESGVGV